MTVCLVRINNDLAAIIRYYDSYTYKTIDNPSIFMKRTLAVCLSPEAHIRLKALSSMNDESVSSLVETAIRRVYFEGKP